jgi:hypothetical protein
MSRTLVRRRERRDMSTKTLKQIAELETLSIPQLEERWRKLFGTDPPARQKRFLIKRLGYRIQDNRTIGDSSLFCRSVVY